MNTTSASARREGNIHESEVSVITSADVGAIATKRELVTVEDFTLVRCVCVASPVPVRKRSSVAAGVDEVVLPLPDEVTVPCEEVGGHVNAHGHVDVSGNVLIVARLHTRVSGSIGSGGDLLQACDGICEALAILVGHLPELSADTGGFESAATVERALLQALDSDLADIFQGIATLDLSNTVVLKLGDVSRRERSGDTSTSGVVAGGTVGVRSVWERCLSNLSRR